jgi:excisionase family DNA binding protein
MSDKLLTLKEAAACLHLKEDEIRKLVSAGKIPAYHVGGMYLRFKEENIFALRAKFGGRQLHENFRKNDKTREINSPILSGIRDFLYFNDFYIISAVLVAFLVSIILRVIR